MKKILLLALSVVCVSMLLGCGTKTVDFSVDLASDLYTGTTQTTIREKIDSSDKINVLLNNAVPEVKYAVRLAKGDRIPVPPLQGKDDDKKGQGIFNVPSQCEVVSKCSASYVTDYKALCTVLFQPAIKEIHMRQFRFAASMFIQNVKSEVECTDLKNKIESFSAQTHKEQETDGLDRGMNGTLVIEGNGSMWRYPVTTESLGEWRSNYGFALLKNNDKLYTVQDKEGQPTIVRQGKSNTVDVVPAIFYSFFQEKYASKPLDWGINGGLGVDMDNITVLAGVDISWYQNIFLNGGVAFNKQKRLKAKYVDGQVVSSDVTSDDLVEDKYAPTYYFALTFRFDSNPFSSNNTSN